MRIEEKAFSPRVYLDHWALNDFATDISLGQRFIDAMQKRGGSLRISVFGIRELLGQGDQGQVQAIINFLRKVDCGFIHSNPKKVIASENILILKSESCSLISDLIQDVSPPAWDMSLVKEYVLSNGVTPIIRAADVIERIINENIETGGKGLSNNFGAQLNPLINRARNDPVSLSKAAKMFKAVKTRGMEYKAATREIYNLVIAHLIKNKTMGMPTPSHWYDVFHVVVPVSYCHLVLIDGRWTNFIQTTGLKYPDIAMVFNKSTLNDFFNKLENRRFL